MSGIYATREATRITYARSIVYGADSLSPVGACSQIKRVARGQTIKSSLKSWTVVSRAGVGRTVEAFVVVVARRVGNPVGATASGPGRAAGATAAACAPCAPGASDATCAAGAPCCPGAGGACA